MDSIQSSPAVQAPRTLLSIANVRSGNGNPVTEHPADTTYGNPDHPPITRWDYNGFSVFFEHDKVVHSVVQRAQAN